VKKIVQGTDVRMFYFIERKVTEEIVDFKSTNQEQVSQFLVLELVAEMILTIHSSFSDIS